MTEFTNPPKLSGDAEKDIASIRKYLIVLIEELSEIVNELRNGG